MISEFAILKAGTYQIDNSGNDDTLIQDFHNAHTVSHSSTQVVVMGSSGNTKYVVTGTGFGNFVNGIPTTGTITGISGYETSDGKLGFSLTQLNLSIKDFIGFVQHSDVSGFMMAVFGGNDTITGGAHADTLYGYGGNDVISGGAGNDTISGGNGNDKITGGAGADKIDPGAGSDTLIYKAVSDSTSSHFDIVRDFDFANADKFDFPVTVTGIDAKVSSGTLSTSSFDSDLAHAITASHLGVDHAVLFTPTQGTLAGETFLIVDANGKAGYQAGHDYVIELDHSVHLGSLDVHDFK